MDVRLLTAVAGLAWALACPPARGGTLPGELVLGAEDDWAPYSSASRDRTGPQGFAVELVRAAFASQNIQVRFKLLPFARCLHQAQQGLTAGCFNAAIDQDNRDRFIWHATPMFREQVAVFTRTDAPHVPVRLESFLGKSVGHTRGYIYPAGLITDVLAHPAVRAMPVQSDTQLLRMLAARRIDFAVMNQMPALYRMQRMPDVREQVRIEATVSSDAFYVAFSKRHAQATALAQAFDRGLRTIRRNGTYARLEASMREDLSP